MMVVRGDLGEKRGYTYSALFRVIVWYEVFMESEMCVKDLGSHSIHINYAP